MATNGKNGKGGRKKINIDWEQFETYCEMQCTLREIADYFNCSEDTIERRVKEYYSCGFAELFKRKRQKGLMSLRVNLFELSKKQGNVAIFLAKNWLGMVDTHEIGGIKDRPIEVEVNAKDKLIQTLNRLSERGKEAEGECQKTH